MGQIDLETILRFRPEELNQEQKDDIFEQLSELQIEPESLDPVNLTSLFNIAKEIMVYKGQQVETLLGELDVLASSRVDHDDREELVKVTRQAEQLVEELQQKEKELLNEKQQVEKLLREVGSLQKEKNELRREIILIQNEAQSAAGLGSLDEDEPENIQAFKDQIQSKNKHILQLLSDIEVLEKENQMLSSKLNASRRELSEATTIQAKLSGENISLREANYQFKEKMLTLEDRNAGLTTQVTELVAEKNKKDAHLDRLIDDLEERIVKWQEVFISKENEVTELKAKLVELSKSSESRPSSQFVTNYSVLTKTIEQQEDMIENLRQQLKEASEDLTKSSSEMLEYKQKVDREAMEEGCESHNELKEQLDNARAQIEFLQEKANDAEQDAQFRAEETTELLIQLREYEDGVYGLPEARKEIRDLKKQVGIRDRQILHLVQQLNELNLKENGEKFTANDDKYGDIMEEDHDKTDGVDWKSKLSQMQQTAINLSVQNLDLRAKIIKLSEELSSYQARETPKHPTEKEIVANTEMVVFSEGANKEELEERMKMVIEENEALRKGMHEIMESIKDQDASTQINIESETLERLLEMLDSRHISGWYHPAMRLQAALNKLQGNNDALRQELRESRFRESYFQAELQTAFLRIGELEEKLSNAKRTNETIDTRGGETPIPAPRSKSMTSLLDDPLIIEKMSGGAVNSCEVVNDQEGMEYSQYDGGNDVLPQVSNEEQSIGDFDKEVTAKETVSRPVSGKSSKSSKSSSRQSSAKSSVSQRSDVSQKKPSSHKRRTSEIDVQRERPLNIECAVQATAENTVASTQTDDPHDDQFFGYPAHTVCNVEENSVERSPQNGKPYELHEALHISGKNEIVTNVNEVIWEQRRAENEKKQEETLQAMLQLKCEEMRLEFSDIKSNTEKALAEMNSTKEALFNEIKTTMTRVSTEVDNMKKQPRHVQISTHDLSMKAYHAQELKLTNYGLMLEELRKSLLSKDKVITAMESRIRDLQIKLEEKKDNFKVENDRTSEVQAQVDSLQCILKQKEEVISRYQALIKENGEEYSKLLSQYRNLEASQTTSSSKVAVADTQAVGVLMEKWLARVHHLEEDIRDLTAQLADSSTSLDQAKADVQMWKDRTLCAEVKLNSEPEKEILRQELEIEELKLHLKDMKAHTEAESRLKLHQETNKLKRKEEHFRNKEKEYESEINRLKHQLSIRSAKGTSKSVKKEMVLVERIKELEEELDVMKQREKTNLQLRREKCADEVAKWEERKKLQSSNERLKADAKEKNVQLELLEGQVGRLKQIISRMERERVTLQRRLKVSEGLLAKNVLNIKDFEDNRLTESRLGVSPSPLLHPSRSHTESPCSESESTKVLSKRDMIKAITALKKVVNRLRVEKENFVHKDYVEQLRKELRKMEENYMDAVERGLSLEEQLRERFAGHTYVGSRDDDGSNGFLREQLIQKCELLGKVKVLLQRAMVREKQLIQQVTILEKLVPPDKMNALRQQNSLIPNCEPSN